MPSWWEAGTRPWLLERRRIGPLDDRKLVIVTVKRRPGSFGDAPDMTPGEHRQRGDAATELWCEMIRRSDMP